MNHKNNLQKISLCIPRIDTKTPKKYIQNVFHTLNIGIIEEMHEILIMIVYIKELLCLYS